MNNILDERIYTLLQTLKNQHKYNYVYVIQHILKEYVTQICFSDSISEIIFPKDKFSIEDVIFVIEHIRIGPTFYNIIDFPERFILKFI